MKTIHKTLFLAFLLIITLPLASADWTNVHYEDAETGRARDNNWTSGNYTSTLPYQGSKSFELDASGPRTKTNDNTSLQNLSFPIRLQYKWRITSTGGAGYAGFGNITHAIWDNAMHFSGGNVYWSLNGTGTGTPAQDSGVNYAINTWYNLSHTYYNDSWIELLFNNSIVYNGTVTTTIDNNNDGYVDFRIAMDSDASNSVYVDNINVSTFITPPNILTIQIKNIVNGTTIKGLCINLDNGTTTTLCNNTGNQVKHNVTGVYNISWYNISGNTYYNQSLTNYNFSSAVTVTANTSQSRLFVRTTKLFLNTLIQNFTITNDQVANNTNSYGLFIPANNASNNLMAGVTGNYTLNQSCTSPLLGNGNCTISGVYDFRLNLSANNVTTALTNYTYVVYNSTLGILFNNFTTTHLNILNLLQGYHYDVNLSKSGFVKNTTTINANTSNIAYNATLKPIQIDITFRDEQNRTLLPGVNITTIIIESDGTQNVYYTNTSSLTLNGLFPPGSYTLRYGATGYSLRDYYFNLTAADANLTLYLIIDSVYSPGIVEVRDYDGTVVPDAIVRMIRFYGDPTVPSTVQMGTTNNDGEAVFVAEVVTSFYLWEVEVDGELRYNTSVPELLVLESDGLWHKTFVLSQGASTARSRYTGYTYNFRPEGALANNTRIEFTFNITSSYWNMTSCTFELRNTSGSVLNTTSVTCGASLGNLSLYYTPTANLVAYATISTLYHTNEYQQAYNVYYSDAGNYTFQTLIDDIDAFSGSGFNTQSKFILSIVFIIIIVLGVSRATDLISSPEETLFLIFVLSVLFSYADWLHLPINSPFPAAEQYMVSIILGIVWLVAYWRKEGIAQ